MYFVSLSVCLVAKQAEEWWLGLVWSATRVLLLYTVRHPWTGQQPKSSASREHFLTLCALYNAAVRVHAGMAACGITHEAIPPAAGPRHHAARGAREPKSHHAGIPPGELPPRGEPKRFAHITTMALCTCCNHGAGAML